MADQQVIGAFDSLESFRDWWLQNRTIKPPFDQNVVTFDENITGATLYRDGQFQVQLFSVKPNTEVVDHFHPNVDSFEIYLGGEIEFRCNGEYLTQADQISNAGGLCSLLGYSARVKPTDVHGGKIGPMGGLFLSVQHWLNGVAPSSVHMDWEFHDTNDTRRNKNI